MRGRGNIAPTGLLALAIAQGAAGCGRQPAPSGASSEPAVVVVQKPVAEETAPRLPRALPQAQRAPWGNLPPLEEWDLGQTAADSLARIGPAAVPPLIEVLRSGDPQRRARAARVLARMGPLAKEAAPSLVAALDDPDPQVRIAAARALGQIGPDAAAAVPALIEAMLESDGGQPPHDR